MGLTVATNLSAINAQRQYNISVSNLKKSQERLSSGYRINRAADDAAGLTISEKMRAQIRGLNKGSDNVQDGISLMQVADGALSEVSDMLHRMTELSIQAANDTNTGADRRAIQEEINSIQDEINRIGQDTEFNTMKIFTQMDGVEEHDEKVTSLLSSPAALDGYMTEAYYFGGKYYSSGSVDFSKVNASNLSKLEGQGFSFNCGEGCAESFDFKFTLTGSNNATNLDGRQKHYYTINVAGCTSGTDVVNRILSYVSSNPPTTAGEERINLAPGALAVSHANYMVGDGSKIIVYANRRQFNTAREAQNYYAGETGSMGQISCSDIHVEAREAEINNFHIQCSSDTENYQVIQTKEMNTAVLGVDGLSVSNYSNASSAITSVANALEIVSGMRSEIGAYQNRLEHTYASNQNTEENTQAAESRIRDTDMSEEMVNYSAVNIIRSAGEAMIAQANRSNEGVLSLLQG